MANFILLNGNANYIPLADESVHCVVTSPPYWGLRKYTGLDDNQLGMEPTPERYVNNMVAIFREVRRVLRKDGTVWLNLGDSYNGSGGAGGDYNPGGLKEGQLRYPGRNVSTLKPKDLCGIPWRVAFALQADGWWLRSDIIWAKPNPMPESIRDRPTKAHEYLFLFSKSARYYYDVHAVRERGVNGSLRNQRTVWKIVTSSYRGAHFATYPLKLVEPCIKAGTSEYGVCMECGAPQKRIVKRDAQQPDSVYTKSRRPSDINPIGDGSVGMGGKAQKWRDKHPKQTVGWKPTCSHDAPVVPATVLDPFVGSGTMLLVANQLGRNAVGLDLSFSYLNNQARERLSMRVLDKWINGKQQTTTQLNDLPMFNTNNNARGIK